VKILSSFLIFVLSSIHFLTAQNPLQEAVDNFKNNSIFNNASISFCAIDLSTGLMIAEYNPNLSLSPASIVKLFSTATAFEVLGSDYKPSTRIYIDGKIDSNGVLQGNLWIRGGGDPTLGSKYFNEEGKESQFLKIWCDTLKQLGIKNIAGSIVSDASQFGYTGIPEGWNWSDMGNYYGAGPSGLVIYDNMVKYTFKTGSYVGAKTELLSIFPSVPNFQFHNYITTSKKDGDNSFIFGAPYSLDRFGNGTLPLNSKAFVVKGSMPDPEFQIAYEFEKVLKENGITTEKGIKTARQMDVNKEYIRYRDDFELIYTHFGQSVLSIATHTNMKSVNLFAEELLCLSGCKLSGYGSTENSLKQLEKFWSKRLNFTGLYIKDGSGLSRSNAISARHFCDLLQEMYKSSNYADFLSTLPLAGCSGTLSDVCKNQLGHGRIKAKSGTLNRVKAYSGYVDSESGKKIAFAIIVNNFNSSSSVVVDQMEKIFNVMATY
jgi:D-alanyl-D-alanine carboxypeptidase/D-alanyl-D-alanine-endopeptidase (penicillin-binding protein 4)